MKRNLRLQLTIQFVLLFVALYFIGGAVAIVLFASKLDASLDEELHDVANGALASVEYGAGRPSLQNWSKRAALRHDQLLSTIQVFDKEKSLLEEFGPPGAKKLSFGNVNVPREGEVEKAGSLVVRSYYTELMDGDKLIGYLQVQVSVKQRDEALKQIIVTMLALTPFLALSVALCGSWFSGNAVRPVEETMDLLRQFVMDAAHEINTPVAVIEASLQTLEAEFEEGEGGQGKPAAGQSKRDILRIIERATNRMKNLGQSLIVLSKLESPQYQYEEESFTLSELVSPVVEEVRQLARARSINFEPQTVPEGVRLSGNLDALQGMLLNLLSNACNYSKPGGRVTLAFANGQAVGSSQERPQERPHERPMIAITVADNGLGIPAESLPKIFERFYRVDSSRSRNLGGCGLGLSIVKATLDRHRGEITVLSNLGQGSTFTVRLPLASA